MRSGRLKYALGALSLLSIWYLFSPTVTNFVVWNFEDLLIGDVSSDIVFLQRLHAYAMDDDRSCEVPEWIPEGTLVTSRPDCQAPRAGKWNIYLTRTFRPLILPWVRVHEEKECCVSFYPTAILFRSAKGTGRTRCISWLVRPCLSTPTKTTAGAATPNISVPARSCLEDQPSAFWKLWWRTISGQSSIRRSRGNELWIIARSIRVILVGAGSAIHLEEGLIASTTITR